jgi:hypothetical protein
MERVPGKVKLILDSGNSSMIPSRQDPMKGDLGNGRIVE